MRIASGTDHGYNFLVNVVAPTLTSPAFFLVQAIPTNYGMTYIRSFYIDADGALLGADKKARPPTKTDPPVPE